ncbi:MAG: DEAD/DEAH box helicase, partial [Clostridia bacterium]|nr:DEAD/DEAH box helicase [Clostridia bacterium]
MNIKDLIINKKIIPRREAIYAGYPKEMSEEICGYLREHGIDRLYSHQAEMFERAYEGKNVVITTSTASGKTLSFLMPVLQEILKNPLSRAIFIYPTKALASDQYRALLPYMEYFKESRVSVGVYDGDTPTSERSRIRKSANIILTNPEMLNAGFMPNHSKAGFDFIFANLKYIVIDELHTYRGAFGSHVANVFRRLSRICRYYHSDPQFLCSSATIANPVELAEGVCGKEFVLVDKDGSGSSQREYDIVQPPKILGKDDQYYGQVQASTVAAELIPQLAEEGHSFIAFARSRRNVEVILKESRDNLDAAGFLGTKGAEMISGYRGGYTPRERKEIEKKMVSGEIAGLVSTNALELGIDMGQIDTVVTVGYPGTRASFWQQKGRAGRSGRDCTNYLILAHQPFDQYIAVNPDWLFENDSESAVIDKNNLLIELSHIRAAAAELPLTLDDIGLFPDLGESIPVLMQARELTQQQGGFAWSGDSFPAGDFSLRNIDKVRFKLLLKENGAEITEMDEMQAYREMHLGAIYMHDGAAYEVVQFDCEMRTAYAALFSGNYYTVPEGQTSIRVIHQEKEMEEGRTAVAFGDVNVDETVLLFKKLQFHNHQNLGYVQLPEPLSKAYDTESTWITIPENVVRLYRGLLTQGPDGQLIRNNHFEGLCHAVQSAAMMAVMAEQEDIGTAMSDGNLMAENLSMHIYDKYVGGLGYAEKAYELLPKIIQNAVTLVEGCPCEGGCAACI